MYFCVVGDDRLSDAEPPDGWARRVGQLVVVVIDALRADFVLPHLPAKPVQSYKVGTCR